MNGLFDALLDLLYPPKCVFCHRLLADDETEICNRCRLELPICGRPSQVPPYVAGCAAALWYEDGVRQSLLRFKFSGLELYAACYGKLLAAAVSAESWRFDAVTWVPVSRRRQWKRGYDQARQLAAETARALGKPLEPTLVKIRSTQAQSTMPTAEARRANVLGVYRPREGAELTNRSFLLIDDILTTGATMSEAARVLLSGGAANVYCAVLAAKRDH